ncbi:2',3'-cyclic-nucleotide 3'-phosphodiesterase isoform X2 [Scyliorhinus canicula]|uniref:2',3'-cyclic-nucleotide 3'-phosphodiesterase isoform X2 n=1 Tax=Scyliorhinus canicula TaxID=7830 RepID=UPI0018F6BCE2|nr:2',3'-cyclic-nucleotide 3'-phosphodiesterase isoform X2 [Scyliorhinus canicula]
MRSGIRRLVRNLITMGSKHSKSRSNGGCDNLPFLNDKYTIQTIKEAHTFFVLSGLSGSASSTLRAKFSSTYPSSIACTLARPLENAPVAEAAESVDSWFAPVDEKVQQALKEVKNVILVDDDHRHPKRLDHLASLARDNDYIVVIVTPWAGWDCQKPADQSSEQGFWEHIIPYYFGWFLVRKSSHVMRENAEDFLKLLANNEEFSKMFRTNVEWHSEKTFDLQEYFQKRPSVLHCTTKFCDFGEVPGCKEYARSEAVVRDYAKAFTLNVTDLFVTPRTVGARVRLDKYQDQLWPRDEAHEGGGDSEEKVELPFGSRAHITLACAPGVRSVQTGLDLLEILKLEEEGTKPECQIDTEKGLLRCYGVGRWIVKLPEAVEVKTIFSGFYSKKKLTTESDGN